MRTSREKRWKLYLFILLIKLSLSQVDPILHGNMIYELTSGDLAQFKKEAQYWTASGLVGTERYSTCGSLPFLGGSNILKQGGYFERTYPNLPSHDIIIFSLKFSVIDQWNPTDTFSIYFDGKVIVPGWSPGQSVAGFNSNGCGHKPDYDLTQLLAVGKAYHNASTLTVRFTSNLKASPLIGGVALRYVVLLFGHKQPSDQEMTCSTLNAGVTVQGTNMCVGGCTSYQYYQGNNICRTCPSPCSQCFAPAPNQCVSLVDGYYFDGYTAVPCASGCSKCFGPDANQCNACNATLGYYNYWDHTCQQSCPNPFIKYEYYGLRCKTPCQDAGSFMLWDDTCSDVCDPPLVQRIEGLAKFCEYPCSGSETLYWNGACIKGTCEPPSKITTNLGKKICNYPCQNVNDYWWVLEGQCKSKCEYPFKVEVRATVKYCVIDAGPDEIELEQKLASASNGMAVGVSAGSSVLSILTLDHTGLLFMTSLTEMLRYIQFLKLKFPPRLYLMLYQQNTTTSAGFGFIPKAPIEVSRAFHYHELPQEFQRNDLHSSFAVNSWRIILSLSLILVVIILLLIAEIIFTNSVITKISEALRWNFFFSMFSSCYSIIAFFTAIEFRTFSVDSFLSIFSFAICLIMNAVGLIFMIVVFCVCQAFRNIKTDSNQLRFALRLKKTEAIWSRYKITFELYNRDFLSQQIFMFLFLLRAYMHYAIVGYFNEYPLAQSITLTVINVLMLGYLLLRRPMKILVNYIQQIACEIILLIVNICMIIFAAMDNSGSGSLEARATIGDVVIYANMGLSVVTLGFLAVKVVIIVYQLIYTRKPPEEIQTEEPKKKPKRVQRDSVQNDKLLLAPAPFQHARVGTGPNLFQRTRNTKEDTLNTINTNPTQVLDLQWRPISNQPQTRVRVKKVKKVKKPFLPAFK